ncbi:MAG: hypothetical protein LBU62_01020, partial [Bacteroidales bacterium]|nr:hypothetical protein [Bacteroidales bacterium]
QGDQTGYFEVPQRNNDLIVLMETRNFMFMRGTTYGNTFRIIYFKNQNVGYNIIDHNKGEIKNDLDGGPDFFPEKGTVYGECVYKSFSVYEFISDKKSNQQPVPEQFASYKANLNDNPCIMRVTLK